MFDLKKFRKENKLTQVQLAEYLNVTQGFVSQVEKGARPMPEEYISKIIADDFYIIPDFNKTIQLSKQGDASNKNTDEMILQEIDNNIKTYEVPLLPISAQGGSLNDFVVSVKDTDCEKIISPIKNVSFAITVAGDSMAPEFPSGSQILIKKIDEKAFIEWGKVYVLDTCNGVIVKRLIPSEKKGYIKCLSDNNPMIYAPFDVCTNDVFGIYRVMLCMSVK